MPTVMEVYCAVHSARGYKLKECEYLNESKNTCYMAFVNCKHGWGVYYCSGPHEQATERLAGILEESLKTDVDQTTSWKNSQVKYYKTRFK